jgi:RHS repeat-associated protein
MAVYEFKQNQWRWTEQHLYGAERTSTTISDHTSTTISDHTSTTLSDHTSTTLSDHLGNVMAVVKEQPLTLVNNGVFQLADVVSATDYFPFGLQMPERVYEAGRYGFGFNGKINDEEILSNGRWQDYGFRAYRPDLGRFVSVDPLAGKYPELTTYQFASNTPICAVDLDGLEALNAQEFMSELNYANRLSVTGLADGYGEVQHQTFQGAVKSSYSLFLQFQQTYLTNLGAIHNPNNDNAYYPLENSHDDNNYMKVGDKMFINIKGPVNGYVELTGINAGLTSFQIDVTTLYHHTDVGTVTFSASYDFSTSTAMYKIENTTRQSSIFIYPASLYARYEQVKQWNQILKNGLSQLSSGVEPPLTSGYEIEAFYRDTEDAEIGDWNRTFKHDNTGRVPDSTSYTTDPAHAGPQVND